MNNSIDWIDSLKPAILGFLSKLKSPDHPGYYSYSLSGDIFSSKVHWGLGNSVFAAKIYYMLDTVEEAEAESIVKFIKSFQDNQGNIYDKKIERLSRLRRVAYSIWRRKLNNLFNEQARIGETRQSFAALRCLGSRPDNPFLNIPYTKEGIEKYIHSLNWKIPWEAAGVLNHLLFFLYNNRKLFHVYENETDELIAQAFKVLDFYKQDNGAWFAPASNISDNLQINGAMKVVIAYESVERNDFTNPEGLIDLCLSAVNDGHACNNFNIICVLYHCSRKTSHRIDEIKDFCISRLDIYKKHYWPEHGGFSFFEGRANDNYLGAKITKGLDEPDIHGTVLFLWGIILIMKVLGLKNAESLKIPIT